MNQTTATQNDRSDANGSDSRIKDGLGQVRATASQATTAASDTIETNPLGVLAGGLALGAIAGALIPRTDREKEMLRPVGDKLGTLAAAAVAAAKDAGRAELENRGLTKDSARDQVKSLLQNVGKAASGAATAAVKQARQEATGKSDQPDSTGGTGDSVPPINPHQQVMPGDRETSVGPSF